MPKFLFKLQNPNLEVFSESEFRIMSLYPLDDFSLTVISHTFYILNSQWKKYSYVLYRLILS